MKIKVSEATNLQIDWLVAKCEGNMAHEFNDFWLMHLDDPDLQYSTNWNQGGPILEENKISVTYMRAGGYMDSFRGDFKHGGPKWWDDRTTQYGSTYLLAGMRCYVASKLGEEVEIPEDLK